MPKSDYEIVIKATDQASPVINKVQQRFGGLSGQLRQGGDIGDIGAVKRVGKNLGEFFDLAGTKEIKSSADDLRKQAAAEYAAEVRKAADVEKNALVVDKARTGAMLERSRAATDLQRTLREIESNEKRQIAGLKGRNLFAGERGVGEIKEDSRDSRTAAEKAYQDVLARSVDVQMRAAATDKERIASIHQQRAATAQYAKQLDAINKAEAEARKQALAETRVSRGLAAAGGVLLAVKAAGELAKAYDTANEKLEKGEITAGMFAGEMAKAVPIIGSVVQSAETLLMVVTGTAKAMREANAEAAKLDKTINDQNNTRKGAKGLAVEFGKLNETEKGKILSDAKERLDEIADLRERAKANNTYNQVEGDLKDAEAAAIQKREADLAAVEAREREARAKQIEGVEDRLANARKAIEDQRTQDTIASLKEQGREQEAAELQIRSEAQAKRDALDKERQKLQGEKGLTDQQRIAINNSIDAQKTAVNESEKFQVEQARRDALRNLLGAGDKVEEKKLIESLTRQGRETVAAQDGRFRSGQIAQSRSVETFRDDQKAAKDTAKATKETADGIKTLNKEFAKIAERLRSVVRLN